LTTYHGVPHEEVDAAARILRLADLVACVSTDLMEQLAERGIPAERLAVVPNGVPDPEPTSAETMRALDAELGLGVGTPVVSVVGRLVPQKAHDRFLRAAKLVHEQVPEAKFLVVGDGELRAQTEALAAQLGLADAVVFTGIRSDATTIIARSDLLVFSSDWEGLSIAALEALARGSRSSRPRSRAPANCSAKGPASSSRTRRRRWRRRSSSAWGIRSGGPSSAPPAGGFTVSGSRPPTWPPPTGPCTSGCSPPDRRGP
jgi:glycosyltransferase involved in cell wall biosynthesis